MDSWPEDDGPFAFTGSGADRPTWREDVIVDSESTGPGVEFFGAQFLREITGALADLYDGKVAHTLVLGLSHTSTVGTEVPFSFGNSTAAGGYECPFWPTTGQVGYRTRDIDGNDGASRFVTPASPFPTQAHVEIEVDVWGGNVRFWVNGVLLFTEPIVDNLRPVIFNQAAVGCLFRSGPALGWNGIIRYIGLKSGLPAAQELTDFQGWAKDQWKFPNA